MKISTLTGLMLTVALAGRAQAGETDYVAGSRALPLQQSAGTARAIGMGSAVVGVDQGAASLLWNPAGLARMSCKEASLHHNSGLGGTIQEIGVIGIPLGTVKAQEKDQCASGGSLGGLAASLGYVNYGSFDGADAAGNPTGGYQAGEYSGSLGYGKEILPHVSVGAALRANKSRLATTNYYAYTADVGLLWNVVPSFDLGLTYNNFNLASKMSGNIPAGGVRVGAGWHQDKHLLWALSTEMQAMKMDRIQAGVEYLIGNLDQKANVLALRGGYDLTMPDAQLTGLTGLTLGLGYAVTKSVTIDYAFLPTGDLGISHRLSATYKFGCPVKPGARRVASSATAARAPIAPKIIIAAVTLEDAHFDFDKATLKPSTEAILKENVKTLKENPNATVEVSGYASAMGTTDYNQTLSELRAKAVSDYFVKEGVDSSRITTIGYGESRPKTAEANPEDGRSAAAKSNMRVIFEIVEHD